MKHTSCHRGAFISRRSPTTSWTCSEGRQETQEEDVCGGQEGAFRADGKVVGEAEEGGEKTRSLLREVKSNGRFLRPPLSPERRHRGASGARATANDFMAAIHDRMPVILDHGDIDEWLDPEVHECARVLPMVRPCPSAWAAQTRRGVTRPPALS